MTSCLRETDTVARFGGDEFVIVVADVEHIEEVTNVSPNLNLHEAGCA